MTKPACCLLLATVAVGACAGPTVGTSDTTRTTAPITYHCQSGATIVAAYPTDDTATVVYQGRSRMMRVAISGSGARYVDDALEWWTKGSGPGAAGTLFTHRADGSTGAALEQCRETTGRADTTH